MNVCYRTDHTALTYGIDVSNRVIMFWKKPPMKGHHNVLQSHVARLSLVEYGLPTPGMLGVSLNTLGLLVAVDGQPR